MIAFDFQRPINRYNVNHKPNFENNPTCRLINPSKSEIGRVSKQILDEN